MWIKWVSSFGSHFDFPPEDLSKREKRSGNSVQPCKVVPVSGNWDAHMGLRVGGLGSFLGLGFLGQIWWRWAVQEQWTTWWWKTKRLEGIPTSLSQISVFVYSSARLLSCKERNVNPGWVAREFRFYLLLFWLEGNKGGAPTCKTLFCVKSIFEQNNGVIMHSKWWEKTFHCELKKITSIIVIATLY